MVEQAGADHRVLHARGGDRHRQQQAQGVSHDAQLAANDSLPLASLALLVETVETDSARMPHAFGIPDRDLLR